MTKTSLMLNLRDAGHEIVLKTFSLVAELARSGVDQSVVFHPDSASWKGIPCDIEVDVIATKDGWTAPIRVKTKGMGPLAVCDLSGKGKGLLFRPSDLDLHFVDDERREKEAEAGGLPVVHYVARTLELMVGLAFKDCLLAYTLERMPFRRRQEHYEELARVWSADAGQVIGLMANRAMHQVMHDERVTIPDEDLTPIDTMSGNSLQALLTVGAHKPTKRNIECSPTAVISFSLTISYGNVAKQEDLLHRCMGEVIVGVQKRGDEVDVVIAVEHDRSDNPLQRPELEEPLMRDLVKIVESVMLSSPLVA